MAFTVLPFGIYNHAGLEQSGWVFRVLGAMAVFGLTLGPFLASALGFGGGLLAGVLFAIRARPSGTPPSPKASPHPSVG
jgi:hypothetical protein